MAGATRLRRAVQWLAAVAFTAVLAAVAAKGAAAEPVLTNPHATAAGGAPPPPWRLVGLPAQRKPFTAFEVVELDGGRALRVTAHRSYGNLVHAFGVEAAGLHRLAWRWRVDQPLQGADLRRREAEDMALRLCASFDLPLAELPFVERQLLRAARAGSAYDLPSAALCYVWDGALPPGTVLASPFTPRIRYLVLRGPEAPMHTWQHERRDLVADFRRAFAPADGTVPPLLALAVGADADNTHGHSVAHLADLALE